MRIAIVDYGISNLFSLGSAIQYLGHQPIVVSSAAEIAEDFRVILLPGVGSFPVGMEQLRRRDLVGPLRAHALRGGRLLGICLGAQLLLESSEEFGETEGLGLIDGRVRSLKHLNISAPAVGWSRVRWKDPARDLMENSWMYFVHSFVIMPSDSSEIAATTERDGVAYTAAVKSNSILGLQFHPEKSGPSGIALLASLLRSEQDDD